MRQSIHNPNIAVNLQSSAQGGCLSMARAFRDEYVTMLPLRFIILKVFIRAMIWLSDLSFYSIIIAVFSKQVELIHS
jgi:hypothetical protein